MKSRDWDKIKDMSGAELITELSVLQDKIFRLKFRHAVTPLKNPLEIREMRRNIARIKTLLAQKKSSENKIK
jgi:large subunit ribosomal protein L29